MKKSTLKTIKNTAFGLCFISLASTSNSQNVGINPTGSSPDASAGLDVNFTNKGFLVPRLTTTQRDAITSPAEGLMIYNTDTKCYDGYNPDLGWVSFGCLEEPTPHVSWPVGYVHCGTPTEVVEKVNPTTGKTWMDRNLGASREAQSSTDAEAYGSLFQWGRFADGHQCVNRFAGDGVTTSGTTSSLSSSDTPGHGSFITYAFSPWDWRNPQNDNLWQGVNGINNPCPDGYRLPTNTELDNERVSWTGGNNATGAFNSLSLPVAGLRNFSSGSLTYMDSYGFYWSSAVDGTNALNLFFDSSSAFMGNDFRADGLSVRCFKD